MISRAFSLFLSFVLLFRRCMGASAPNIIFFLADDCGWSDFGYNFEGSQISTPYIDSLSNVGISMSQYYTHSMCTPARASLLTGLYHINTGLTYALMPGSLAGLPDGIATLPNILRLKTNYSTYMSGKWHLGNAQLSMTPTGKGFDEFTGIYSWATDSYTKQIYTTPWATPVTDWVSKYANGTYSHFAEPRHTTDAITANAIDMIDRHVADPDTQANPLFLYVPYTAAHSPLQPLPHHEAACAHIPHLWRRQFCGMVVGLDDGIRNVTEHALRTLGSNTIVVVTSDNGASTWFGGLNEPLRGTKSTAFEGGVRVPALIVDFAYPQERGLVFDGLMHVSDWMPTLLAYAGIPADQLPENLDGMDFSPIFGTMLLEGRSDVPGPRREVLLEMYYAEDHIFGEESVAYRLGDYKYIRGIQRDPNYYTEPKTDRLTVEAPSWTAFLVEKLIRFVEWLVSVSRFDMTRITVVHVLFHDSEARIQRQLPELPLYVFNIREDPQERHNLAADPTLEPIIAFIQQRIEHYRVTRRPPAKVFLQYDPELLWPTTFVPGDCSMNPQVSQQQCRFTRPWVAENEDPWALQGIVAPAEMIERAVKQALGVVFAVVSVSLSYLLYRCRK